MVTGIPRSGTSLFSWLLNKVEDNVCINEALYDWFVLPGEFDDVRLDLLAGRPIPGKWNTTDTHAKGRAEIKGKIHKDVTQDVTIGSKVNVPYLVNIKYLIRNKFKIYALVRNPVYTVASWRLEKNKHLNTHDMINDERYQEFGLEGSNLERQCEMWNRFARLIYTYRFAITIVRYEDLVKHTQDILADFCQRFGKNVPDVPELECRNILDNYDLEPVQGEMKNHNWYEKFGYSV